MFYKLFVLLAVCSVLVASKDIRRRDVQVHKAGTVAEELKKEEKRSNEMEKKSVMEKVEPPAAVDIALAETKDALDAAKNVITPKKRSVNNKPSENAECCG